jgi:hypothetical protein
LKLTKDLVEELASIKAQKSALEKREKELVPEIKEKMAEKEIFEFAPEDCPYKLVRNLFEKASVRWKEEWIELAKQIYGKKDWKKKNKG